MGFNNFEFQIRIFGSPNFAYIRGVLPHSKGGEERDQENSRKKGRNTLQALDLRKILSSFIFRFWGLGFEFEKVGSWNLDVEVLVCCSTQGGDSITNKTIFSKIRVSATLRCELFRPVRNRCDSEDSSPRSNLASDGLLVVEHRKFSDEFSARNILCQFLFNHGDIAAIHGTATYLCIWDPGISFKFKALMGTVNTKPPLLLGSTGTFGFIVYANSVTQVWDPGQQRCMHSPILLFVFALTAVTSLNFNSRDTFAKWAIAYKMVVMELKVDDTCAEVNRVFEDSSQRVSSREIQSIAPLDIICPPKLFRFLQQLLAQLIFVLQAPKSKVRYAAIGGDVCSRKKIVEHVVSAYLACLQGCIKTMVDSIE
ncbi:hypothetical protein MTR67_037231 [Solanum verrucosum]|uniref:Uncharacterized protein n=1 Tax=Solanum verrucosum TaxID=315347 RepID=A0AAF0ZLQ5_SOLVR|nr:hypothetical protein MTR67_037231 [Solanum verrucosum]